MEARFDSAEGTSEYDGDVVEGCFGEETEFDDLAMLLGQVGNGLANPPGVFGDFGGAIGQMCRAGFLAERLGGGKATGVLVFQPF